MSDKRKELKIKRMVKQVGEYWVDSNHNSWSIYRFDEKTATALSKTMINCVQCVNCRDCKDCRYLKNCEYCVNCVHSKCCYNCSDVSSCTHCSRCSNSNELTNCYNCHWVIGANDGKDMTGSPDNIIKGIAIISRETRDAIEANNKAIAERLANESDDEEE